MWPQCKKLAKQSDLLDLKVRSLTNFVNLLLHGEPIVKHDTYTTDSITKRYVILASFLNIRKVRGCGWVEEQCFSFTDLKLVVDGPLLYVTNTVVHVAEQRISGGVRS